MKKIRGFTLIELLVVIAIISLLSATVMTNLNKARLRSRDIRRLADLRQVQKAVEFYYDDNGHYPDTHGAWTSFDSPSYSPNDIYTPNAADLSTAMSPYLTGAKDPKNLGGDSGYLYTAPTGGASYCILFYRTPEDLRNFGPFVNKNRCNGNVTYPNGYDNNGQCVSTPAGAPNSVAIGIGPYAGGC